tara:strand:- start:1713 stop:2066 length:354 start_codon:yes stop_codon:yes gene_type:complete
MKMIRGNKYRIKDQPETPDLMYVGFCVRREWHQFTKYEDGIDGEVWHEMSESELYQIVAVEENLPDVLDVLDVLREKMEEYPELRLGQLIEVVMTNHKCDLFNIQDDELIKLLKEGE